jgi:adenylosuccinate synthase
MSVAVVVGAQWGDEGKGKIVDLYTEYADVVVRYAGGANAGHTLVVGDEKVVVHLMPSGILRPQTHCVVGQGMVLDLAVLCEEIDDLAKRGVSSEGRLHVSNRAHVILPYHKLVDSLREARVGALGTTKRGIGPAYEDKAARRGIRMLDLARPDAFREKVVQNLAAWAPVIRDLGGEVPEGRPMADDVLVWGERLAPYSCDASRLLHDEIRAGKNVLFEGAQGTLLDLDQGTYPFVTSSSAVAGGACTGAGIGPTLIDHVIGITKAYTTRVGEGPFPTELQGDDAEKLRTAGAEFGATTGRPRRVGWLDVAALRLAVRVNGMTGLAVTKLDVLSGTAKIRVCVAYRLDGKELDEIPLDRLDDAVPVYDEVPGWTATLSAVRAWDDLPEATRRYVERIESWTGCPVFLASVGARRTETFVLTNPFKEG